MAIVKQINYSDLPDDIQSHIVNFSIPYDRESKLTNNAVGWIGTQALALALKSENTKLKILELDNADIRNEATELLADALKSNKILEKLVLSYNKIGDVGAKALADALELNTTLKTLDLRYCFIKNKDIFKPYLSRVNILM